MGAMGEIGILNVGAGDTKIVFDPANPEETARAKRIVTDLLQSGYAILIEVPDDKGEKAFARVTEFDEGAGEYIIRERNPNHGTKPSRKRRVPAAEADGVAVARPSGG